jgi:hypothetical protein
MFPIVDIPKTQLTLLKSFMVFKCGHKFHKKCIVSKNLMDLEKESEKAPQKELKEAAKVIDQCIICVKYEFFTGSRR